jgi:hypothetical protein
MKNDRAPNIGARILVWFSAIWMIVILVIYWIVQGSPGVPGIAEISQPFRDLLLMFFSAPYLN